MSYTSESTGGAERQAYIPKDPHSTTRFHKALAPLKRRSLSPLVQRRAFQTCGERMPNCETHGSHRARGTRAGASCQIKQRFQSLLPKHKEQQAKSLCTDQFTVNTKVDKEVGVQK